MALEVNKSSYYKWLKAVPQLKDDELEALILEIFNQHSGTYGKLRIQLVLKNKYHLTVNHKKVYRIMKKLGLSARIRRKWRCGKYIKHNVYDNVLNREFKSEAPRQKLVSDITQLRYINNVKYYLYPVVDLFNNEIISYKLSRNNNNDLVIPVLEQLSNVDGALFHSDQGAQFTSHAYSRVLKEKRAHISMSHVGECYDNAQMESIFGHIKDDFYAFYQPETEQELFSCMDEYIQYYNNERIQLKLKMSPVEYRTLNM